MKMRALLVALLFPIVALGGTFTTTTIDSSTNGSALFNPNAAHIARNANGVFAAYQVDDEADHTLQRHRVVWYAGDPANSATVRTVLYDASIVSNAGCVAVAGSGEVWVAFGNWNTNILTVLKWSNVNTSTTPQIFTHTVDMGQNGKHSCAWDESRRSFLFIGTGFELARINEDGTLKWKQKLVSYPYIYMPQYPNLQVAEDGNYDLGWTTVDLTSLTAQYRSIHYLQSRTGGDYWSVDALIGTWEAQPGTPVRGDEGGPARLITFTNDDLLANTWLTSMLDDGRGGIHFNMMHVPNSGESALVNPNRVTVTHYKYPRSSLSIFWTAKHKPLRGGGAVKHAVWSSLQRRGDKLYVIGTEVGKVFALRSDDWGETWHSDGEADLPGGASKCAISYGAERGYRGDPDIVGIVGMWAGACTNWPTSTGFAQTDVTVIRYTP